MAIRTELYNKFSQHRRLCDLVMKDIEKQNDGEALLTESEIVLPDEAKVKVDSKIQIEACIASWKAVEDEFTASTPTA
jgi:hypothetical protein